MAFTSAVQAEDSVKVDGLKKRCKMAKGMSERAFRRQSTYLHLWQLQAELFYVERADFTTTWSSGEERWDGIHTSAPAIMRRDMANNLGAMIRPRGKNWFNQTTSFRGGQLDDEAKRWFSQNTDTMRNIVYERQARFTSAMSESDHDYVTFGNAVIAHGYRANSEGMLFKCLHLRDVAWSRNADLEVDVMHGKPKWTLRQVVSMFGKDALPKEWADKWDKEEYDSEVTVCWTVMPIALSEHSSKERYPKWASFVQVYWAKDVSKDCELGERYVRAFPFTVREWMSVSGEEYARSPCTSVALSDGRTLNTVEEAMLTSVEDAVRPPKYARRGILESELDLRANTVTFISDDYSEKEFGPPIANIQMGDPRYGMELGTRMEERIGMGFFQNILKLPDQGDMTAYEVAERIEIYVREAAPIFEPMEAENAQLMDSVFSRALPKGAFGAILPDGSIDGMPQSLKEQPEIETKFEFETPLSEALKRQKALQFDAMVGTAQGLMALQHPKAIEAVDNFDWDAAVREGAEGKMPVEWLTKPEDRDAVREARIEAERAAQEKADAMDAADMALNANPQNIQQARQLVEEQ